MKKHMKRRSYPAQPQIDMDITGLIFKMHQQLVILEKKIDTLIGRPSERPFEGKPNFKPFQRFDQPHRQGEFRPSDGYKERTLHKAICADCNKECEVPFKPSQDRPVYCKECFSKRKAGSSFKGNSDNRARPEEPARERPFHKYRGAEDRRPYDKKRIPKKRKKRD